MTANSDWRLEQVVRLLEMLDRRLVRIIENQETQMATAAQLTDALNQTSADLQTLLAAGVGGVPETDLDPVLAAVQALDAAITAAIPQPPTQ